MNNYLERLHRWLESSYRTIGIELTSDAGTAVWTQIDGARAELGDSQIGLLSRFAVLTEPAGLPELFQREVRWALEAASQFDYRASVSQESADALGAWQVQIVWIVTKPCKEAWLDSMRELRARSSHAEELGLELIDLSSQSLEEALASEGLSSLMFRVRELMRRRSEDMPAWISPDSEVESRLRALPSSIMDKEQREFAAEFLDAALVGGGKGSAPQQVAPNIGRVKIHNVRNIVDAEILISADDHASVIHGPNGTGKSSLFEAVCFALLGTSKRHCEFVSDKDVLPSVRSNYVGQVLKRFGSGEQDKATITVGQTEILSNLDSDPESLRSRLVAGRGTVLAQESAREFLEMNALELASYVLGDYSALARRVQTQVDEGAARTKTEWQEWLRSYGLNAAISKADTILRRLVGKVVQSECPPEAQAPLTWIKNVGELLPEFSEKAGTIQARWNELDSTSPREAIVEQAALAIERAGSAERPLASWLGERALVSGQIVALIQEGELAVNEIRSEWPSIRDELTGWGSWLEIPPSQTEQPFAQGGESDDAARIEEIHVQLAKLGQSGQQLRARKDHLSTVSSGFLPAWQALHAHTCPTCDVRHNEAISVVIANLLSATTVEYERSRVEYSALLQEEKDIRSRSVTATAPCPVAPQRQQQIATLLRMQTTGPDSLESALRSHDSRAELFQKVERLFATPAWKPSASIEAIAASSSEMASKILELRSEGALKQEWPIRWDSLKKSVDTIALDVVGNHLPRTIGALWKELSLVLAPAYWIQGCAPQMTMELKRGAEKLGVTVRRDVVGAEVPARHVLNQAEQHVLGLAWFFTRYLTHGRFLVPFMALDDPAQEMDQVTFRKFARFVQAFQRAHRFMSAKFGILVLLHQEERAIEFARLITENGALTVLEWSETVRDSGPDSTVRTVQLRNPEQRARKYSPGTPVTETTVAL